eukprot:1620298-Lingulodinium_polyedra.AAC.1
MHLNGMLPRPPATNIFADADAGANADGRGQMGAGQRRGNGTTAARHRRNDGEATAREMRNDGEAT